MYEKKIKKNDKDSKERYEYNILNLVGNAISEEGRKLLHNIKSTDDVIKLRDKIDKCARDNGCEIDWISDDEKRKKQRKELEQYNYAIMK